MPTAQRKPVLSQTAKERRSLATEARAALAEADGDVVAATSKLFLRVIEDHSFIKEFLSEIVRKACYEAVAGQVRADRRQVWSTLQPTAEARSAQVMALASGTVRTLHDFPLPGGKKLGDALRGEVVAAADFFRGQASDMARKAHWLQHIAQHVPDGKTVRDVLSAERLAELRDEVSQ